MGTRGIVSRAGGSSTASAASRQGPLGVTCMRAFFDLRTYSTRTCVSVPLRVRMCVHVRVHVLSYR